MRNRLTTTDAKAGYEEDGYLIAPNLLDAETVAGLLREATELCRTHGGKLTDWNDRPIPNGDELAALEETELLGRVLAIHFPHKLSDVFRTALTHPGIVDILALIVGPNVKCAQSMLFFKQSGKPGQAWHQDEHFIPTRDRSLTGVWIALDRATEVNGCLRVLPGSHRPGVLYPTRPHDMPEYDGTPEAFDFPDDPGADLAVELDPGDVLFFNGYLLHRSLRNRAASGTTRRALVHHYLSAESLLPWNLGGLIDATDDNRDIVMVCGEDPYSWKGLQDFNRPFIRTEAW